MEVQWIHSTGSEVRWGLVRRLQLGKVLSKMRTVARATESKACHVNKFKLSTMWYKSNIFFFSIATPSFLIFLPGLRLWSIGHKYLINDSMNRWSLLYPGTNIWNILLFISNFTHPWGSIFNFWLHSETNSITSNILSSCLLILLYDIY